MTEHRRKYKQDHNRRAYAASKGMTLEQYEAYRAEKLAVDSVKRQKNLEAVRRYRERKGLSVKRGEPVAAPVVKPKPPKKRKPFETFRSGGGFTSAKMAQLREKHKAYEGTRLTA